MKQIPTLLFLACLSLLACKKNPHHPQQRCPEPLDCQLTVLHTTQGIGRHSDGPEVSSEIFRGADKRPVKYRGYITAWETPTVSNITYAANRMTLTDSATGRRRLDVWFNACGQPDSATWHTTDLPNEFPSRTHYKYNAKKQLTGFTTYFNEIAPPGIKFDVQVIRDAHGNVLKLTDGSSITEWTYDYNAPVKPLQIYYLTPSTPIWSPTFLLEMFGFIDFRPRHIPKTITSNMGGYPFDPEVITDVVIQKDRVLSYVIRSSDNGQYIRTITHAYTCKNGNHPKF